MTELTAQSLIDNLENIQEKMFPSVKGEDKIDLFEKLFSSLKQVAEQSFDKAEDKNMLKFVLETEAKKQTTSIKKEENHIQTEFNEGQVIAMTKSPVFKNLYNQLQAKLNNKAELV